MIDFDRLKEPFPVEDLEWRVQSCGEKNGKFWALVLTYVTARAVMDRLDRVAGPDNWQDAYREGPQGGVLAGIGIRINGEWVWKWDGAENTDIEAVKGGLSNAFKRVAVKWGIGRYLYRLEESFANVHDGGAHRGQTKEKKRFRWDPPALPDWAIPSATKPTPASEGQLNAITELMRDTRIKKNERERIAKLMDDNPTAEWAVQTVAALEKLIKERTAAA